MYKPGSSMMPGQGGGAAAPPAQLPAIAQQQPAGLAGLLKELSTSQTPGQIVVLKVGTSSLVNADLARINLSALARIVETVKALRGMGESRVDPICRWTHGGGNRGAWIQWAAGLI
jgi:hypothetical protein